ncbi:hypothetical protein MBLNU13_g10396t2 [Cladosporium sp. NU13]
MSNAIPSSDHHWKHITAQDHARLHTGHVYGQVNNIHNYAPDWTNSAAIQAHTEREWRADLLGWLVFAEIDDRREQVHQAHQETFKWIFDDGNKTGFAEWLSSGDGIFWINGKPASGKSTLIKFITEDKRLEELLALWTRSSPMVLASFYFWVAGSPLQRSLVGLYRTLLHQMLKKEEHMCRVAFPDWQRKFKETEPTLGMLTAAVNKILTSGELSNNFFFIIDGLDEYDRDSIGKTQLAKLMLDLTHSPRVKVLLSSRPETPFKIAFLQCPTLRLEELTKPDVSAYVNKRLWSNTAVKDISSVDTDSIRNIASFILNNAQGVFLWVALTLSIALDGISNHEDLAVVRDRVTHLPPELDDIFNELRDPTLLPELSGK